MKKSIKVFTLSLLASGMLVGCGADPAPAPDWSAEQKQEMKEILYGEVLPYVSEVSGLEFRASVADGFVAVFGDVVSPEQLASYAEKYTKDAGWKLLGSYKVEEKALSYTFEKQFTTREGTRYVDVQFGGINANYEFVENGEFMLFASDPYSYSYEDIKTEVDAFTFEFEKSEYELPAITGADLFETYKGDPTDPKEGHFLIIYCYSEDAELADKYHDVLEASEDNWKVYPIQEDPRDGTLFYMADSPDGKYGIQYLYNAEEGCMVVYISDANYSYEFPVAGLKAALVALGSEATLPEEGYPGARFDYLEQYKAAIVYFDEAPEGDAGYGELLANAGWVNHGYIDAVQQYVVETEDKKASARMWFDVSDPEVMYFMLTGPAFVEEFPEEVAQYIASAFYSEDAIPDVEGAEKYIFNNQYGLLGIYYESEEKDGGYGALLEAAGFKLSKYIQTLDNGSTIEYAFSADRSFYVAYNYYEGVLSVLIDDVNNITYYTNYWPADEIAEINEIMEAYNFEIPALTIASEQAYYEAFIYTKEEELLPGWSYEVPVAAGVYVEGATLDELAAYLNSFGEEWSFAEGSSIASGFASKEDKATKLNSVSVEWMTEMDEVGNYYFHIAAYFAEPKPEGAVDEFPSAGIQAYFNELGIDISEVPFVTYATADKNAYFVPGVDSNDQYRIEVYGSSVEEQAAYIEALEEAGWTKASEPSESYPYDFTLAYGETGIYVDVQDYTDYGGYIRLIFFYQEYVPEQHSDEFPLEEVNTFLADYELGFSLTSGLPTDEGKGYDYLADDDGTYHYFKVTLSGDHFNEALEALVPVITANGYEVAYGSVEEFDITYENEDYHQVNIYINGNGDTVVVFWE